MFKILPKLWVGLFLLVVCLWPVEVFAFTPTDLTIIELKMTGSESMVLANTSSGSVNLKNYVLQYFNTRSPSNLNVPTSSQALPDFSLAANQSILLSGDTAPTCGAAGESNLGMALSDTSGYVQIVKFSMQSGSTVLTTQDHVSWTSSSSGADINAVPSSSSDAQAVWYRKLNDGSWNRAEIDTTPCSLFVTITPSDGTTYFQWATGSAAPATVVASSAQTSGIPTSDIGLAAPQITELLPNPSGTGNDSSDEFIELYNPNNLAFDLSGFTIEVGLTTKHDFTFDPGSSLAPNSFTAFYSSDTSLSLSNTGGQAWLLDPMGSILSQSDPYGSAKDGQAWALAGSTWYWTTTPTPNEANLINGVPASSLSKTKTTPIVASTSTGSSSSSNASSTSGGNATSTAPVHPWVLAVVGGLALLYAGYEYRHDLANNFYRLRRYRKARATAGGGHLAAGVDRIGQRLGRWQNDFRSRLGRRPKK